MKLFKRKLGEEARYTLWILAALLTVPLIVVGLDRVFNRGQQQEPAEHEKRIIVKDASPPSLEKPVPQAVVETVRDAIKNGNYSTAYLSVSKMPADGPEYKQLRQQLAAEQKKQRPGLKRKPDKAAQGEVHYYDESTPSDRTTDWMFVSFTELAGAFWPHLTIQLGTAKPLAITSFRVVADGKSYDIPAPAVKSQRSGDRFAQWYEAPLDQGSYSAVLAASRARKATLLVVTASGVASRREMGGTEKKGLSRILEAYQAVGGNMSFIGGAAAPPPRKHARRN